MCFLEVESLEMTRKLWDWTDFSLVAPFLGQVLTNVFFLGGKNIAALTLEQNGGKFIHIEDKANNFDIFLDSFSS